MEYGELGDLERRIADVFVAEAIHDVATCLLGREALWGGRTGCAGRGDAVRAGEHRSADFLASLHGVDGGTRHLDDDFEMVRDTFHRFARDKVRPLAEHIHRNNADIPEEVIAGLAELGTFGLSIPERYGGYSTGGDGELLAMVVATEELSWASLGVGGSPTTRPEILARAMTQGATDAMKQQWLPRLANGEVTVVAVTEPDFGSDSGVITTTGTRVPDGDGWVINGVKTWCTFAGRLNAPMLMARTDADRSKAHRGVSMFLVSKPRAGSAQLRIRSTRWWSHGRPA